MEDKTVMKYKKKGMSKKVKKDILPTKCLSSNHCKENSLSEEMKRCRAILKTLFAKKHNSFAWAFYDPVDVKALGLDDYFDIIKQPMDLGTVKKKLAEGEYKNRFEFAADVRLIFQNCYLYNSAELEIVTMARKLENVFEARYNEVFNTTNAKSASTCKTKIAHSSRELFNHSSIDSEKNDNPLKLQQLLQCPKAPEEEIDVVTLSPEKKVIKAVGMKRKNRSNKNLDKILSFESSELPELSDSSSYAEPTFCPANLKPASTSTYANNSKLFMQEDYPNFTRGNEMKPEHKIKNYESWAVLSQSAADGSFSCNATSVMTNVNESFKLEYSKFKNKAKERERLHMEKTHENKSKGSEIQSNCYDQREKNQVNVCAQLPHPDDKGSACLENSQQYITKLQKFGSLPMTEKLLTDRETLKRLEQDKRRKSVADAINLNAQSQILEEFEHYLEESESSEEDYEDKSGRCK